MFEFFVWIISSEWIERRGINWSINWPNPSNNDIAFFVCKHFLTDKAHYRKIDFLLTFIHTICRINFSIVLVLYILIPLILYAERSHDMVASYYEWNKKKQYTYELYPEKNLYQEIRFWRWNFFLYKLAHNSKYSTPFSTQKIQNLFIIIPRILSRASIYMQHFIFQFSCWKMRG